MNQHPAPLVGIDQPAWSLRNVAVSPAGRIVQPVPSGRLRRWWLRRRGWTLHVDDGLSTTT